MRILIVGGMGMLGHKLFQMLGAVYPETYATVRSPVSAAPFDRILFFQTDRAVTGVDVTDFHRLTRVIQEVRPDYIVNCVGVIKQRKEALSPIKGITLNALLPHKLAEIASTYGGRLIHFSTDCVFDGTKGSYTESDSPNARDMYGQTKALGEVVADNVLILRTSIIGRELRGHASLLDWFLMQSGKTIQGFTNAIYSGVTTNQMARVVQMILENHPDLSGLYQVVADPINKYELLKLTREKFKVDVQIEPFGDFYIDRSMCGDKFKQATGYKSPPWAVLMQDLADEVDMYREWGISL